MILQRFSRSLRPALLLLAMLLTLSAGAQQKYTAPALSQADSWSMILVPDPQTYNKFSRNQPLFELMTQWIAENIDFLKIKLVLCTGDLVEQNEFINPDGKVGNQPSKKQWEAAARAFGHLDAKVPYIAATGNHDYGYSSAEVRITRYNEYFPVDKNFLTQKMLREVTLNGQDIPTMENAVFEFTSPHGKKMLVLNLEFAPRDTVLAWATGVVNLPKYNDHFVIVLTHSYLNAQNEHIVTEGYKLKDRNYGAAIFEKLIKPSKNIRMVFGGHIGAPDNPKAHIAFRTDLNAAGKKVHQMVFNAQALGGGWFGNGGDGWLRILEFTAANTVKVRTFSPLFAISPITQQFAWRTEAHDQFEILLD
ncbi:metallophosphoesterase [uncultured Chitinophaga sp.]|nr:metallophosphoesterase [uncultured Chitinophaga sp.]